jgi:hypothetical protein
MSQGYAMQTSFQPNFIDITSISYQLKFIKLYYYGFEELHVVLLHFLGACLSLVCMSLILRSALIYAWYWWRHPAWCVPESLVLP